MKLNKKLEVGMNAIAALRKRDNFVRTKDIADEVGTTVNFLEQIMRNLRTEGIVNVKRGPGGGFMLNKEADITAMRVARAVGRQFDAGTDESTTTQLRKNIIDAFSNTKL